MPNMFLPISPGTDQATAMAQINQNFAKLDAEAVTKVVKGVQGLDRSIEGRLPNGLGYGLILYDTNGIPAIYIATDTSGNPIMKVAKTGQDATTAPNSGLIFNSANNVMKVLKTDTVLFPGLAAAPGGSFTQTTISIDTGIASTTAGAYLAYLIDGSNFSYQLPYMTPALNGTYGGFLAIYRAATRLVGGNIHLDVTGDNYDTISPLPAYNIRYYIFAEPAQ